MLARSLLLLLLSTSGTLSTVSASAEVDAPTASVEAPETLEGLLVVHHAGDPLVRDRLRRVADVWLDAGRFLVVRARPRVRTWLATSGIAVDRLPPIERDEELYLIGLREHEPALRIRDAGARLLFRQGALAVVAVGPGGHERLHELASGRSFHCDIVPFRKQGMRKPRGFAAPVPSATIVALGGAGTDPDIQALVDQVDEANVESTVAGLSAIPSRRSTEAGATTAQNQLHASLSALGLAPYLQPYHVLFSSNVVADIPGVADANKIVVIGAHYDSINFPGGAGSIAPGADDNASGCGGVLEAARIFANAGPFKYTLRFALFSGEENGLLGSGHASGLSVSSGEEILGMLNLDMISYRANGDARDVDFATNNTSAALTAFCDQVGQAYVPGWASSSGVLALGASDHASYNADGWPAVFFFEDLAQYNPEIHTANDVYPSANADFLLAKMVVQGVVAAAATLAEPADLALAHAPLADTANDAGPYPVVCQVASLNGANVTGAELHYAVDGGAWSSLAMTLQAGDWTAAIPSQGSPRAIEYYVTANDDQGSFEDLPAGADLGAAPFAFFVGVLAEVYANDFEALDDAGWTHGQDATQDDWQHGAVNGSSGDPAHAWSGRRVWGNDLGAIGFNGGYPANVSNWLRSPTLDLSSAQRVFLRYRRWLTVEDGLHDQAEIRVNGTVVWRNEVGTPGDDDRHTVDTEWTLHTLDVTAQAAGNPAVQVEFRLVSDGGFELGGWNVDDFTVFELDPIPLPFAFPSTFRLRTALPPIRLP